MSKDKNLIAILLAIVRRTCHHVIHHCLNPNGCWLLDRCEVNSNLTD